MNIREELNRAAARLARAGSGSPRLDAEILLTFFLNIERLELYKAPERILTAEEAAGFEKLLERRCQGEPVAYIIGFKEFWSLLFLVNREVLIPRPETEILVEETLQAVQDESWAAPRILEIGVGSGAITVALARELPEAILTATDIAAGALDLARENARRHGVAARIDFRCGDLWTPVEGTFDLIVSNPPYISSDEFHDLQKEVRGFEPYGALVSGQDGLQMFRRIITHANTWLKPGGYVIFEAGEKQARKVARLFEETRCFKKAAFVKDYQRISRIVIAQMEEGRG